MGSHPLAIIETKLHKVLEKRLCWSFFGLQMLFFNLLSGNGVFKFISYLLQAKFELRLHGQRLGIYRQKSSALWKLPTSRYHSAVDFVPSEIWTEVSTRFCDIICDIIGYNNFRSTLGSNMYTYLKFGLPRVFPPNHNGSNRSGRGTPQHFIRNSSTRPKTR